MLISFILSYSQLRGGILSRENASVTSGYRKIYRASSVFSFLICLSYQWYFYLYFLSFALFSISYLECHLTSKNHISLDSFWLYWFLTLSLILLWFIGPLPEFSWLFSPNIGDIESVLVSFVTSSWGKQFKRQRFSTNSFRGFNPQLRGEWRASM